ncbi:MAG TPA: hypothetical protein VIE88_08325, partial [Vicinamibacteria bacterium]
QDLLEGESLRFQAQGRQKHEQGGEKRIATLRARSAPGREEAARRRRKPRGSGRPPRARSEGSERAEEASEP